VGDKVGDVGEVLGDALDAGVVGVVDAVKDAVL
jgi:hypothetical protein